MLTGVTLAENQVFTSVLDTSEDEEKTKFTIGVIDVMVRSHILDNSTQWRTTDEGMVMQNRAALRNFELIRFGLKGVENFKDPNGNDIQVTFVDRILNGRQYKVVSDDFINRIPGEVIPELAEHILQINMASETLRKK